MVIVLYCVCCTVCCTVGGLFIARSVGRFYCTVGGPFVA
jgi:hypothetical protein